MVAGPLVLMASRLPFVDLVYPYWYTVYDLMIPIPELSTDFNAPWKPFSLTVEFSLNPTKEIYPICRFQVWILVLVSMLAVIAFMSYISGLLPQKESNTSRQKDFTQINRSSDYVFQVLMSQGNLNENFSFRISHEIYLNPGSYCLSQTLSIRLLAGVWCLASFFLVYFYNSTLISFISASVPRPIIEKMSEIPTQNHLRVVVNYGWAADIILTVPSTQENV